MSDPTRDELRRAIDAQVCPWCQRGPFVRLAGHTWRVHQIDATELRSLAGYSCKQRICSEEESANSRERLLARPDRDDMTERGLAAAHGGDAIQVAQARRTAKLREEVDAKRAEVIRLFRSGLLLRRIAEEVQLHHSTVGRLLREAGVDVDATRQVGRDPVYAPQLRGRIREAQMKRRDEQLRLRDARLAEFRALGGDESAVPALVSRWGMSCEKVVRYYLRRHGELGRDTL